MDAAVGHQMIVGDAGHCVSLLYFCFRPGVSNSSPVHVFEPLFWTSQLLDNLRLKDWAIFHGSIFNADP